MFECNTRVKRLDPQERHHIDSAVPIAEAAGAEVPPACRTA